jgi:hypothetical protein
MMLRLVQASANNRITSFFVTEATTEEHAVTASEFSLCYHNVAHCGRNFGTFQYLMLYEGHVHQYEVIA